MNPVLQEILHNITSRLAALEQSAQSDKLLIDLIQEQRAEIDRLRAAQPEQEPVAWVESLEKPQPRCVTNLNYRSVAEEKSGVQFIPLYTSPQKREWQELTDEDWHNLPTSNKQGCERDAEIFNWIEDKLKEKNT